MAGAAGRVGLAADLVAVRGVEGTLGAAVGAEIRAAALAAGMAGVRVGVGREGAGDG